MSLKEKLSALIIKYQIPILLLLCIVAFFARITTIQRDYWYDEAYTGLLLKIPQEELNEVLLKDTHPPLYLLLLKGWTSMTGTSEMAIRAFSVFAGILLIPLTFLFITNIFKNDDKYKFLPLIASLIVAINPFLAFYSSEARSYSFVVLIFTFTALMVFKSNENSKYRNVFWLIASIFASLSFLTHYALAFGIVALYSWDFLFNKSKDQSLLKYFLNRTIRYVLSLIIFTIILLPFKDLVISQIKTGPTMWWVPKADPSAIQGTLYSLAFGVDTKALGVPPSIKIFSNISTENIGFFFYSLLLVLLTYVISKSSNTQKRTIIFLAFNFFIPLSLTLLYQLRDKNLYLDRYLIAYGYFFIILMTTLFFSTRKLISFTALTLYLIASIFVLSVQSKNLPNSEIKELVNKVSENRFNNSVLVFNNTLDFTVAKYYLYGSNVKLRLYKYPEPNILGWAIVKEYEVMKDYVELKDKQRVFVYKSSELPDIWYRDTAKIGNFYVYSTIPLTEEHFVLK